MVIPTMPVPPGTRVAAFASVVLDVDSTLSRIEGIEWLAHRRGPTVAQQVVAMTDRAMTGDLPLDAVYGQRLALVRPTRADVEALAAAYVRGIMPGAHDALATLRERGVSLTIVSGGLREAILPLAASLEIDTDDVHAVSVDFAGDGSYRGFDTGSPLARRGGKPAIVRSLRLPRPVLALGDGSTDAELKTAPSSDGPVVDAFAAFIGVARRPTVVAVADYIVPGFDALPPIVLGAPVP